MTDEQEVYFVHSLETPYRGDANEFRQHIIILHKVEKTFLKSTH